MRAISFPVFVAFASLAVFASTGAAAQSFAYAGFLELEGVPVNGPVSLTFVLETEAGAELATISDVGVLASAGSFSVEVGPVDADILAMEPLFLRVGVDGELLNGRQAFVAVPRSVGANRAVDGFLVPGTLSSSAVLTNAATVGGDAIVNGSIRFGATVRQMIHLYNEDYGIGVQGSTAYFRTGNGFAWYRLGVHSNNQNDPGGGAVLMTLDNNAFDVNRRLDANSGINLSGTLSGGSLGANCGYTAYQSKDPLTTTLTCPAGQYMAGVGFHHNAGENFTYQESFRLYCCSL